MSGGISAASMATTTANVGLGLQAAGTIASTVGAYNKSKQDKAAYDIQAQVQRNNAQYAEWQAQDAIVRGQTGEQTARLRTAGVKGSQRASLAARGIALDEGSALDILTTTDLMGERDALVVRDNANRDAWALREGAKNNMSNAALLAGRADAENPLMSAGSTFMTGAGSVASSWYKLKNSRPGASTGWTSGYDL